MQEYDDLIESFLTKQISYDNLERLKCWLSEDEANASYFDAAAQVYYTVHRSIYSEMDLAKAEHQLGKKILVNRKKRIFRIVSAAASIAAAVVTAVLLLTNPWHDEVDTSTYLVQKLTTTVTPSSTGNATLIIDESEIINLDKLTSKRVGDYDVDNGKLEYSKSNADTSSQVDELMQPMLTQMHTLSVAKGNEFVLVLSDMTEVTLNADSQITYPAVFTSDTREVVLKGQAYFKVSHDSNRPFVVKTDEMDIKVLGTSFDVKAYPGEKYQATLVEGKVAVDASEGHIVLSPSEQVSLEDGHLSVSKVDTRIYTSWKESRFVFKNAPMQEVVGMLERWYDVGIIFASDDLKTKHFTGDLPKYETMGKVLQILEMTTNIRFDIKGDKIIIEQE